MSLASLLTVVSSIFWASIYFLALLRAYRDKIYVIPLPAILLNVAWELLYTTIFNNVSPVGPYVPAIWLVLDVLIFVQVLWYSRYAFKQVSPLFMIPSVIVCLVFCLVGLYFAQIHRYDYICSGFPQDLIMSILFVRIALVREGIKGQSMYVAVFKCFGNATAIISYACSPLAITVLNSATFFFIIVIDLLYVFLLRRKFKNVGIKVWHRL
jgi:hypothetical protein